MTHPSNSHHAPPHNPRRFRHAIRLFILNAILYGACSAFAGVIVGDSLRDTNQMKLLLAFGAVPLVLAVVSTIVHVKANRWTNVDDIAERFAHPHQTPHE
ncbi:MAG: hypothetical protein K8R92_10195 [Planctomycetes bacterium]|nr:hypothetical protein [Planctomycetota bacterium]